MTQESQPEEVAVVEKLVIDRPSDFKFRAAYSVYSQAWDKTASQETKTRLNETILSLANEEIGYESFYERMRQFREHGSRYYARGRGRIETQRKRDWRKREARNLRNARHRRRR